MFSKVFVIYAFFNVLGSPNAATTKKPSKAPVSKKPSKAPISKKPTTAPVWKSQNRIINTENIPLPYNAYQTIIGPKGTQNTLY